MTVRLYRSTDAGATSVTGAAGGLVAVLDAVLVNGYNSATVTITRSGTTATVTHTAHGYGVSDPAQARRVVFSGAGQSEYNIEATITVVDANTYTYQVSGSPATPATGTITSKRAPLGWTIAFTGTNKRAYRAPSGNRYYLRIDDSGTSQARAVGYESMTDVDTGTNAFPTAAQLSGGMYFPKSTTADSTVRPWVLVGDEKRFFIDVSVTTTAGFTDGVPFHFGDFKPLAASDAFATAIGGGITATSAPAVTAMCCSRAPSTSVAPGNTVYLARAYTQVLAGATTGAMIWPFVGIQASGGTVWVPGGNNGPSFPGYAGQLYLGKTYILDGSAVSAAIVRGTMPGVWMPSHSTTNLTHGQIIQGTGDQSTKTFYAAFITNSGWIALEISDTWDV